MTGLRFEAVIFDLDGLVLDSEITYISAWQRAAAEMGYTLKDAFCKTLSGLHGASVDNRVQAYLGSDFDLERFHRLCGELWASQVQQQGIPIKKGFFTVLSVVERLKLPFCIATNSRRRDAIQCLELAGLQQVFQKIIARDDVACGKPAPDLFIAAAATLGKTTSGCLVLEDSPVGIAAALAAGAPCVYVPSVYPVDEQAAASAMAVFDDLDQVAEFILAHLEHSF